MRTILLGICALITSFAIAQRECASSSYIETLKSSDATLSLKLASIDTFLHQQSLNIKTGISENRSSQRNNAIAVIKIPVVVHVLYNSAAQNISDAQIKSQIDALNRDFRRDNADSINTPDRFKPFAADAGIEFVLATADPNGRYTTGILRKQTSSTYFKSDDKIKFSSQGGDDAWDSRYYLNIWVGNLQTALGYSSIPGADADKDGIVIAYTAFGTINMSGSYNMGRTAVHEAGHWLGLKHIWGDTYCGDDLVNDTPTQGNFTSGCPTGFRSSCSNGEMGDMYMNYMDFTADECMNLFTEGQTQRMRTMFDAGGPRNSILNSKGLNEPWVTEAPLPEIPTQIEAIVVYPNPASTEIVLKTNGNWIGKTIRIININGSVISLIQITSASQKINLSTFKPGIYLLHGEIENEKMVQKFIKF